MPTGWCGPKRDPDISLPDHIEVGISTDSGSKGRSEAGFGNEGYFFDRTGRGAGKGAGGISAGGMRPTGEYRAWSTLDLANANAGSGADMPIPGFADASNTTPCSEGLPWTVPLARTSNRLPLPPKPQPARPETPTFLTPHTTSQVIIDMFQSTVPHLTALTVSASCHSPALPNTVAAATVM